MINICNNCGFKYDTTNPCYNDMIYMDYCPECERKITQKQDIDYCPGCSIAHCQGRYTTGQCE